MNTRILGLLAGVLLAGAIEAKAAPYRMLLESDANADPGDEVYALSYASWSDLLNGDFSDGVFTQIGISSLYSIADFTFDGTAYRMLLESDANADPGEEVYALSYASWDDLLNGNFSAGAFTQIGISSPYSIAGLTFDGTAYRMLLESDANADPGDEVYALSYASWDDLLNGDFSAGAFTQIGISSPYSIAGFDAFQADAPTATVPEPSTLFLFSVCLASALAGRAGRQRLRLG